MSRNLWSWSSIVLVLAGVLASPVLAQERSRPGGSAPVPPVMEELDRMTEQERGSTGRGSADADMEEGARHFQAKKRERLMQALQLDEATRNKLNQRLEQLDQRAEDLRRQKRAAVEALRGHAQGLRKDMRRGQRNGGRGPEEAPPAAGAPGGNVAMRQALERVYAMEEAMAGLRRERLQVVRDLLTPEQQVKFLLFNMRFQKEMRERLQREHGG